MYRRCLSFLPCLCASVVAAAPSSRQHAGRLMQPSNPKEKTALLPQPRCHCFCVRSSCRGCLEYQNLSSWQSIVARSDSIVGEPQLRKLRGRGVKAVSLYPDKVQLCQTNYMAGEPTHGVYQSHMSPPPHVTWGATHPIGNLLLTGGDLCHYEH